MPFPLKQEMPIISPEGFLKLLLAGSALLSKNAQEARHRADRGLGASQLCVCVRMSSQLPRPQNMILQILEKLREPPCMCVHVYKKPRKSRP